MLNKSKQRNCPYCHGRNALLQRDFRDFTGDVISLVVDVRENRLEIDYDPFNYEIEEYFLLIIVLCVGEN
ncbi:hypothetical protein FP435_04705 [Lactobacillus sp. PV037]|uniref:hypothetical protein n=1 Tax=Lactobacillus sp. PV037 TaxID=2594496 RepID=UPI002240023B|nr:hypothetical protein [Lactobacillus sp. PV037]QNQ83792.1 hypothetical protein FP435_04705 [Lactobacillus sp. PV037]